MNDQEIKILLLEDLPSDATLAEYQIKQEFKNYSLRVVETEADFVSELLGFEPDIVISDFQLPSFDGLSALKIVLEKSPYTPVIILTGSMNEDTAVDCMKAGASDYVIKEHIKRLGPSITNALLQKKILFEKREVADALHQSQENFHRIILESPLGIRIVSETGNTVFVNEAFLAIYGVANLEEFISIPAIKRYTHDSYIQHQKRKEKRKKEEINYEYELKIVRPNNEIRVIKIWRKSIEWNGELHYQVINQDITDQKQAEEDLKKSEEKFSHIFHYSPYAITLTTIDTGKIIEINDSYEKLTGFSKDELIGKSIIDLNFWVDEKDRDTYVKILKQKGHYRDFETKFRVKSGEIKECIVSGEIIEFSEGKFIYSVIKDISESKKVSEQLKRHEKELIQLTKELRNAEEITFKRISLELHDEVGQLLTAMKINIAHLKNSLHGQLKAPYQDKIIETDNLLNQVIDHVHDMAVDLRPSILDHLGLLPALRWYIKQFAERTNLKVQFKAQDIQCQLNKQIEINVYRIVQEALSNIIKHAEALQVLLKIQIKHGNLTVEISDNGKGFDVQKAMEYNKSSSGLGLIGMRERVIGLNGQIHFNSQPEKGAKITIEIPVN